MWAVRRGGGRDGPGIPLGPPAQVSEEVAQVHLGSKLHLEASRKVGSHLGGLKGGARRAPSIPRGKSYLRRAALPEPPGLTWGWGWLRVGWGGRRAPREEGSGGGADGGGAG